ASPVAWVPGRHPIPGPGREPGIGVSARGSMFRVLSVFRRSPQPERVVQLFQGQPVTRDVDGCQYLGVERDLVQRDTVVDPRVEIVVSHRAVLPSAAHTQPRGYV